MKLIKVGAHSWGPGKIHIAKIHWMDDPTNTTMCGKQVYGERVEGTKDDVTCKICRTADRPAERNV